MTISLFEIEQRDYVAELNQVAAELVRTGRAAPYDALGQAHEIVRRRRRDREAKRLLAVRKEEGDGETTT